MTPPKADSSRASEITRLLEAHHSGESEAFDRLMPLVYDELRRVARSQRRRQAPTLTLDTGALVHEAYLELVDERGIAWESRGHFFGIAARAMRRILVDHARERGARKRGGDLEHVALDTEAMASQGLAAGDLSIEEVLTIDQALTQLASFDERLARVVECRLFAGLKEDETAEALGISLRTAQRDWLRARAWLQKALSGSPASDGRS